ncbi:MAG: hypothetical protein FD169_247 [Bacillota bacterium]|nr:MAG: hypothetical protein FD169_247 [Bacillota bacterium]
MKSFFALLRLSIANYFGLTSMRIKYVRNRQKLWEPIVIGFAAMTLVTSLSSGAFFLARGLIASAPPGQADMGLTLPILGTQVLALFMGLFTLISLFYFSNDLETLVPLPLKEKAILASKFLIANITEYLPALFIVIPAMIAYNQYVPLGTAGWISAVVVFLLLPVVPLSIAGIIVVTLMRGLNRRHRDIMIVLSSLILLAVIMYVQFLFQSAVINDVDIEAILQNRVDLVRLLGSAFPPSVWATRAISRAGQAEGFVSLTYLVFSSVLGVWAFLSVGQRVFYGGLIGGAEHERKNIAFTQQVLSKRATSTPALKALFLREWRLFLRVPIWVLNGFIAVILVPLMAFVPAFTGGQGLQELAKWAKSAPNGLVASTLIFAGMIAALSSLNTLASTSISREGKHLWISKVLPIQPRLQVIAKLIHAGLASLIIAVLISGLYYYMFAPHIMYVLGAGLLGITVGAMPQLLGMLFDIWHPFLTWTNPQHAVKNNLNAVTPLILMVPSGVITYFSFRALSGVLEGSGILLVLTAAHLAIAAVSFIVLLRMADIFYQQLEI